MDDREMSNRGRTNLALSGVGWPTSFGGGGDDDRGHDAERISSTPPGPKDLGHPSREMSNRGRTNTAKELLG